MSNDKLGLRVGEGNIIDSSFCIHSREDFGISGFDIQVQERKLRYRRLKRKTSLRGNFSAVEIRC